MLALAASGPCIAQTPTESLRSCLATFEGIAWRLPYRPALQVHRCNVEAGRTTLELIGALRLGPVRDRAPSDASRAQLQQAVFSHFDALFQRNGFRRVDEESGEAEGGRHVAKARYARGSQAPTLGRGRPARPAPGLSPSTARSHDDRAAHPGHDAGGSFVAAAAIVLLQGGALAEVAAATLDPAADHHHGAHAAYGGIDRWAFRGQSEVAFAARLAKAGYSCARVKAAETECTQRNGGRSNAS
jgi:hypothetical protein